MKIEPESLEIKKEDVDFVLEGLRSQFAQKNTIDRPVQEGDLITFDIGGFVSDFQFMNKINVKARY
jgi:FKBP-type peptidyl-prolyl cis-trans isomerase (trigger factor)